MTAQIGGDERGFRQMFVKKLPELCDDKRHPRSTLLSFCQIFVTIIR
jgi:hypothetical protein